MKFVHEKPYNDLEQFLSSAKESVFMVAPFIQKGALELFKKNIHEDVEVHLTTKNNASDFIRGLISLEAIENLYHSDSDVKIHLLYNLHAKFIIVDNKKIFMGSSNFTDAGLGRKAQHSNHELNVIIQDIEQDKVNLLKETFEGASLDELRLKELKEQLDKARKKYNKAIIERPSLENTIKILDEIRKDEKADWINLMFTSKKEDFLNSKETGFKRVKDLKRIYDVFKKDNTSIKVKEAKRKKHSVKGPDTYSFQIGKLPSKAMSDKKIDGVMHILKDQETEYNKDIYFVIPTSVLKLFYQSTKNKSTSPHYYIHKEKNDKWCISTKFKDTKRFYVIKMKLDSYMNKAPSTMKGKRRNLKDFIFDKHDKKKKKTLKFMTRVSKRK